jgi:hypothetical protein
MSRGAANDEELEGEDLDDDEGDDDEGGAPPADDPAPPATGPAQKPRSRQRPGRSVGMGASAPFQSHLAVDLVGEILDRLDKFPGLGKPWDFDIQVLTMDGRDRRQGDRILGSFSLYRLNGARNPGEELQDYVTKTYHFPRTEAPEVYDIRFVYAKSAKLFSRGKLPLGGREEIMAIRRAQQETEARNPPPPPQGSWTGHGSAPQGPPYGAPPAPAYYPPPSQAVPDDVHALRQQLASERAELQRTQGMLQEALRAFQEGRPPPFAGTGAAPAPAPAPARPESEDERIARIVAQTLRGMGIGSPAGMGAPAPQAAPAPSAAAGQTMAEKLSAVMNHGLETMVMNVFQKGLEHAEKTIGTAMRNATSPPEESAESAEPEPEEPPEPAPDPMDRLPFELVPARGIDGTPVKWPDGSPLMVGLDRETSDFSFKGSMIGNPFVAGQAMKLGQTLGEAAKTAASRVQFPDGSTVVNKTPAGARDAGMGSEPQRPQPQREAPPAPPPPPPHGPNGAAGGGGFPVM